MPSIKEFCSELSRTDIAGRPLSVTLARFHEYNNRLIGCSTGFLELTGRPRKDVMGMNCRFLNQGLDMPRATRLRLHDSVLTGTPFMGILKNKRYAGSNQWETFDNLLHMVVVSTGIKSYIIGLQVNVTGLNLNLANGGQDAARLQLMFDSVLSSGVDSWIHCQEQEFQLAPLYLYSGPTGDSDDQAELVEGQCRASKRAVQQSPDEAILYEDALTEAPCSGNDSNHASDHTDSSNSSQLPRPVITQLSADGTNTEVGIPTMKNQLQALDLEDPDVVIIARGISKLGLSADETIRRFFGKVGNVKAVYIPHTFKKKALKRTSLEPQPREPRAPGRCFIVMSSPTERTKILSEATQYLVDDVEVTLEAFSAKSYP